MQGAGANVMGAMNANGGSDPNQYFGGGDLFKKSQFGAGLQEGASGEAVAGTVGSGLGALAGVAELGNMAFGDTGIDTSGATAAQPMQSKFGAAAGGAMKGAMAGKDFGIAGTLIGGTLGGVAGLFGRGNQRKDNNMAAVNNTSANDKKFNNAYANGGPMHAINEQFKTEEAKSRQKLLGMTNQELGDTGYDPSFAGRFKNMTGATAEAKPSYDTAMSDSFNKTVADKGSTETSSDSKFNPGALLRYAPAAANAYQLATLKKPGQEGYDRLGNVYDKQLVDEKGLQNTVSQDVAGMRDRLVSTSGGSGSTARANLLASQLQGTKALSEAYLNAENINRGESKTAQDFKLNVDKTNLGQSNMQTQANAANQGAYDSQKSALIAQLGNDLGGVGQEELFKQYPELMGMDYNTRGRYLAKVEADKKKKKEERAAKKLSRMV